MLPKDIDFFTFSLMYKKKEVTVTEMTQNVIGTCYVKLVGNDNQQYVCRINPQGFLKFAQSNGYTELIDLAEKFLKTINR